MPEVAERLETQTGTPMILWDLTGTDEGFYTVSFVMSRLS